MKQSDVKTRRVMDFDTFKGAYDRALHTVSRDPDAPLQDGSRKMTAFPAHVRNDSNPYRAFEIPYDKEEADSNMRIMAHPPVFATGGANATGELGESVKYKGQLVRLGDNHGDLSGYAPLDNVEIIMDGEPVLVKFKDLEIVDESMRTEGQRAWRIPDAKREEYFDIIDKMVNAVGFNDSGFDSYSDPIVKFEDFTSLTQRNQEFWIAQMKRIGAVEVTDSVFEKAIVQDPGDNSAKLNLKTGDKVWTIMGPCAGKDYFGVVESGVRKKGMDYVVDVTFYKADTGSIAAGKDEYAVDYLHRLDGKKIY